MSKQFNISVEDIKILHTKMMYVSKSTDLLRDNAKYVESTKEDK